MRRMYSEQELTNIIKEVFDEEVESGVFDDQIKEYAEDWLEENPLEPSDLDFSNIDFLAKTLEQSQANFKGSNINFPAPTGLTITNTYNRLEVINQVLYCIVNFKIENNSGEEKAFQGVDLMASLEHKYASQVIDVNGDNVGEIASAKG